MKRVRCPKCNQIIVFDETMYESDQSLVFECSHCKKHFGVRLGATLRKLPHQKKQIGEHSCGSIIVIENRFHYKQVLPLHLGDNTIGRYMKGNGVDCPIETDDPSIDMHHCVIHVSKDKNHCFKYVLRDGPSNTGTFVHNEILNNRERRVISDETLFTIGATSIILRAATHFID